MRNIRIWIVVMSVIFFLADVGMMYTRFMEKTLIQRVSISCEAVISYPMYIMVIYTFCSNNIEPIKYCVHMLYIRMQFGFFNMPKLEVGPNHRARLASKAMAQAVIIMFTSQLATQITTNSRLKAFILISNVLIMFIVTIVITTDAKL